MMQRILREDSIPRPRTPLADMMDEGDEWFAPMSGSRDCDAPPKASSMVPSANHFLIPFDHTVPGVVERLAALGTVTTPYAVLPLVELEADPSDVVGLEDQAGILGVLPAMAGMAASRTLALGFDFVLKTSLEQDWGVADPPYAGREMGDPSGYPILVRSGEGWKLDIDPNIDWPAPMAVVPVVSFSIGPKSAAYPFITNDLINIVTVLVSQAVLVVAAAGNCGESGDGTMSAWAQSPWILSVGATTDEEGATLAPFSSRGVPDDPDSGPDVVAWGQSVIAPHPDGTSYAAPRVAQLARLVTAALLQLRREMRIAKGAEPHGVPLVGVGMIDSFRDNLSRFPFELALEQALPILGVDAESVNKAMAIAEQASLQVEISVRPEFLRAFLLDCATEIPGYAAHEVGRGFIDTQRVTERLAALTFRDIVGWFSSDPCDDDVAERLAKHRVFVKEELGLLDDALRYTGPHVRYDYRTRQKVLLPLYIPTPPDRVPQ